MNKQKHEENNKKKYNKQQKGKPNSDKTKDRIK